MPAEEEPGTIRSQVWTLNTKADLREFQDALEYLGVDSSVWVHTHPDGPGGRMEVPDTKIRTNPSILVDRFGRKVRTTTLDDTSLINIELLPTGTEEVAG